MSTETRVLCPVTMQPCDHCGETCEHGPPKGPCGTRADAHRWRGDGSDLLCKECYACWTPPATCPMPLADLIRQEERERNAKLLDDFLCLDNGCNVDACEVVRVLAEQIRSGAKAGAVSQRGRRAFEQPKCTECGVFVPPSFVAVQSVGDYEGGPYEDFTSCVRHGGPRWPSPMAMALDGLTRFFAAMRERSA